MTKVVYLIMYENAVKKLEWNTSPFPGVKFHFSLPEVAQGDG